MTNKGSNISSSLSRTEWGEEIGPGPADMSDRRIARGAKRGGGSMQRKSSLAWAHAVPAFADFTVAVPSGNEGDGPRVLPSSHVDIP